MVNVMAVLAATEAEGEATPEIANPILPVSNELFWGAVCFFALWALMKWVLLPPVLRAMDARAEKIRADAVAAGAARAEAVAKMHEYQESLVSAKAESVRVIEDARTQADADRKRVMAEAEADAAGVRATAAAEVSAAKEAARAQLRDSVADIAVAAAGAVVQKPLDRSAQLDVIEDYVNRAGSQN